MNRTPDAMKLIIPTGCDNAPRKQIVIDFTIAMLQQQDEVIAKYADESIIWYKLKETRTIEGQHSFIAALQDDNTTMIDCLEIDQVITHGKFASINGVVSAVDGTTFDFCDVYTFSNTAKSGKVKEIKSYRL